jgi:hypothetical protein
MTPSEADVLAAKIVACWPDMRIPADQWAEAIVELDAGAVGTVFARFRSTATKAPTIADLVNAYARVQTMSTHPPRNEGTPISFQTYLERLARKAAGGDLEAAADLVLWEQNLTHQGAQP